MKQLYNNHKTAKLVLFSRPLAASQPRLTLGLRRSILRSTYVVVRFGVSQRDRDGARSHILLLFFDESIYRATRQDVAQEMEGN